VERGRKGVERYRLAVQVIQRKLALLRGEIREVDDSLLGLPRFGYLDNKTLEELSSLQHLTEQQLKRYEDALRMATNVLNERRH
jgi:hypothetical protein